MIFYERKFNFHCIKKPIKKLEKVEMLVGEMAQQLRIHAALPEDLGFNSQHPRQVVHNCL